MKEWKSSYFSTSSGLASSVTYGVFLVWFIIFVSAITDGFYLDTGSRNRL